MRRGVSQRRRGGHVRGMLEQLTTSGNATATGLAAIGGPLSWAVPGLLAALAVGGAVAYLLHLRHRKRAREAALQRLVDRHPGWMRSARPGGLAADSLVGRTAATPRGDRRYGIRHGVGGPLTMPIHGTDTTCQVGLFEWFSEEKRKRTDANGRSRTTYRTRTCMVGVLRLPVATPSSVRIRSESVLGRLGLTRGGDQVESSEFNRRFRIDGGDRTLTVQLLDANLQRVLLERYSGRIVEFHADLLVLGGSPDHRDDSLTGLVGEMPAIREDLEALLRQVPPQFWRAIGADRPDPPASPVPST